MKRTHANSFVSLSLSTFLSLNTSFQDEAALWEAAPLSSLNAVPAIAASLDEWRALVRSLQHRTSTALGPALITGTALAAAMGAKSEVFLCTDGLPNVGVGRADTFNAATSFYSALGARAKASGAGGTRGLIC